MTENQLLQELDKVSALRENRIRVSNLILQDLSCIDSLINIVFKVDSKVSIRAAWVLEFVVKQEFEVILPYLDYLSKNLQKVHFGGAVRSMAKIIQILILKNDKKRLLDKNQENLFTEIAFDWLISKHKVAIKAYTMQILFLLGKKYKWIHPELKSILLENTHKYSSAYKARARITIAQIDKYKNAL